jgi:MinD superfamily P-loop ATPase
MTYSVSTIKEAGRKRERCWRVTKHDITLTPTHAYDFINDQGCSACLIPCIHLEILNEAIVAKSVDTGKFYDAKTKKWFPSLYLPI